MSACIILQICGGLLNQVSRMVEKVNAVMLMISIQGTRILSRMSTRQLKVRQALTSTEERKALTKGEIQSINLRSHDHLLNTR